MEISSCSGLYLYLTSKELGKILLLEENLIVHQFDALIRSLVAYNLFNVFNTSIQPHRFSAMIRLAGCNWMKLLGIQFNAGSFISICVVNELARDGGKATR